MARARQAQRSWFGIVKAGGTVCGFFLLGWGAAMGWQHYTRQATTEVTDKTREIADLRAKNESLRTSVAQVEAMQQEAREKSALIVRLKAENENLSQSLAQTKTLPTAADWDLIANRCLILYGSIVRAIADVSSVRKEDPLANVDEALAAFKYGDAEKTRREVSNLRGRLARLKETEDRLSLAKQQFYDTLFGAGLANQQTDEGFSGLYPTIHVYLTKYPKKGVNVETGELKELAPSTK